MRDMKEIINEMQTFKKYFNEVRVVDPLAKTLFQTTDINEDVLLEEQQKSNCYDFWGFHQSCVNCISMRAINENDTFVKFEEVGERIFMITAMPVNLDGRMLAIELLKDITKQKIVDGMLNIDTENIDRIVLRSSIAHLNDLVMQDGLTKLYNRKYINEKLPVHIIKSYLEKAYLSIVMVDIDHFKKVNDNYGHVVGDEMLQMFADTLQKNIRHDQGDWVARYGGEEFLICLMNCDKKSAIDTAERIRQAVESEQYQTTTGILNITASFGIQTMTDQEMEMIELIRMADRNLYAAKQSGRNRVVAES